MSLAFVSLGSNIGNGCENLLSAWRFLGEIDKITTLALSSPYLTKPVIKPEWAAKGLTVSGSNFTNAVGALETSLDPHALLEMTSGIELTLGRERYKTADRTLDIDLIYYDDLIIFDENLTLPHPEMHKRHFVLTPLSELAPERIHPVSGMSTMKMLKSLPYAGNDEIVRSNWNSKEKSR